MVHVPYRILGGCADYGTAYGEDGHTGHRVGHDVVWTVPYAQFILSPGAW